MTNIDALIGERVHQQMWRVRVTQATVASAIGVDAAAVSRRLRGRTAWKAGELYALARLLGTTVGELLPDPRELSQVEGMTREDGAAEFRCTPARVNATRPASRPAVRRMVRGVNVA